MERISNIRGVPVGVGYIARGKSNENSQCRSKYMFFILRSISYDKNDIGVMSRNIRVDPASVRVGGSNQELQLLDKGRAAYTSASDALKL